MGETTGQLQKNLPSCEEERQAFFRQYLSLETELAVSSVYHDLDPQTYKRAKRGWKKLTARLPQKEYAVWKEQFLAQEAAKLAGDSFLTCKYLFIGYGQYEVVIRAEELDELKHWIDGNGSAFLGECRPSTQEEILQYIALRAEES